MATRKKPGNGAKTDTGRNRSWGGRFSKGPDQDAQAFTASIGFDIRLLPYDIRGSIAHARMLAACKIISVSDRNAIVRGLKEVQRDIESGAFVPQIADEDIHMAVERALTAKIGPTGAKLHAARSRNDQVVTDVRMFTKDAAAAIDSGIEELQSALLETAKRHPGAIMPGYTHLQRAQPVLLGHHLLAYFDMLERDRGRFADCYHRSDVLPLGSGALAGTTLPIDRRMVAGELGFARVSENSMDSVADRDFVIEFLSAVAILFAHLSRLANEITLWATSEYGFVSLHDKYSTGSSMMPQKKNPDIAELIRGKSGRVYGNLIALLTTVKGLPLAYNSDLQEDKEPLFDSFDTARGSLSLMAALVRSLHFNEETMAEAASDGALMATDLAEHLVLQGLPFRDAHEITGALVKSAISSGRNLNELSDEDLASFCPDFGSNASQLLDARGSVERRCSEGGTAGKLLQRRLRKLARRKRKPLGAALLLAAASLCFSASACGFKTAPRPPADTAPVVESPLKVDVSKGTVDLSWKRSEHSADGLPLYDLEAFVVERSSNGEDYAIIGTIDVRDHDKVRKQAEFSFSDPSPPPGKNLYRVRARNADGQLGPATKAVAVTAGEYAGGKLPD